MDKINFQNGKEPAINDINLNKMQDNMEEAGVVVSPTQPTTNEKVWIQKGKNLSNVSGFNAVEQTLGINIVKVKVKPNTNYTISAIKSRIDGAVITNGWVQGIGDVRAYDVSGNLLEILFRDNAHFFENGNINCDFTIITPVNCDYIVVDFANNNGDINLNTSVSNIQVEQGSTPTEYEAYVEKAIYVKNDNGVYEEFYNKGVLDELNTPRLVFKPILGGTAGDNANIQVEIPSNINGFCLWINTHPFLREMYTIARFENLFGVDTIYYTEGAGKRTTFTFDNDSQRLTIDCAASCRGQLYYVEQATT